MTEQQIKTAYIETLKCWIWLFQNPDKWKYNYPECEKIENYEAQCGMCEIYNHCEGCPLVHNDKKCTIDSDSVFDRAAFGHKSARAWIASRIRREARKRGYVDS
jgi:hypothetical protein